MEGNIIIGYLIGLIPIVTSFLKVFIDSWRATDLEKIMMSNFKKIQIGFTKYILMGIAFGALFYIYSSINTPKAWTGKRNLFWLGILITLIVLSTLSFFLIEKILMFLFSLLSFKYDYYVVNDEDDPVFRVIKLSDKNCLLVESNGIEEFIVNPKERRYKRIRKKNEILSKVYSSIIVKYIFIGCII